MFIEVNPRMCHCMSERVRQKTSAMVRFQVIFNVIQVSSALTVILFSSALNAISCNNMSQCMRFPTMWYVRPAKPQNSLRIRAV